MISPSPRTIIALRQVMNLWRIHALAAGLRHGIAQARREGPAWPGRWLRRDLSVTRAIAGGPDLYRVKPCSCIESRRRIGARARLPMGLASSGQP
jgi:hypothetical protein